MYISSAIYMYMYIDIDKRIYADIYQHAHMCVHTCTGRSLNAYIYMNIYIHRGRETRQSLSTSTLYAYICIFIYVYALVFNVYV